jgi:hypothetical protein
MLGSIEAGKIANLVVSTGDVLGDSARISAVFVDGIRYEVAAPPARPAGGGNAAAPAQIGGTWTMTLNSPQGPLDLTMTITQSGATFSGTWSASSARRKSAAARSRAEPPPGPLSSRWAGQSITLNYRGEIDGSRMTGSAELGSFGSATFTAEKKP